MPQDTRDYSHATRNYMAHGGNELVIGGKLTLLPNAVVDDQGGLLGGSGVHQIEHLEDSDATTVAALRDNFNQLLHALAAAGFMAPKQAE